MSSYFTFTWIIYFITVFHFFFLSGVGLTIFGVGRTSSEFNRKKQLEHLGTQLEHPWNTAGTPLEHSETQLERP